MPFSPFLVVSSLVLVVTIPWILIKSSSTTLSSCPSQAGGWKDGYYKAVTVAPPITTPQTTATVEVIGGEATVRRRKWLETEEEGVSKGCWYPEVNISQKNKISAQQYSPLLVPGKEFGCDPLGMGRKSHNSQNFRGWYNHHGRQRHRADQDNQRGGKPAEPQGLRSISSFPLLDWSTSW